jgi:hypothetical protein
MGRQRIVCVTGNLGMKLRIELRRFQAYFLSYILKLNND